MREVPDGASGEARKALHAVGEATLNLLSENDAYTEYLWDELSRLSPRPVQGRVLEMGCGIGSLTRLILRSASVELVHAVDLDPAYVERVRAQLSGPRLRATPARAEDFCPQEHTTPEGGFDAIVSSNVLEHIEDHERVVRNFKTMLRPGGVILILVPAHPCLYSSLDRNLSHFRRYRRCDMERLAQVAALEVLRIRHFNPLAALGWWFNGKVLRRRVLPSRQVALYSRFGIRVSKLFDRLNPLPFGISLLAALAHREVPGRGAAKELA